MLIAVGRPRTASSAKLGPDSNASGRPGCTCSSTSGISSPLEASMPLAQITTGLSPGSRRADLAHRLRRTDQQQRVARPELFEARRRHDSGFERNAGQIDRIGALVRDRSRDRRIARPQRDLASGAPRETGERRAPGAAADDADMADVGHRLRLKAMEMRRAAPR